jgi:hypothetical protein
MQGELIMQFAMSNRAKAPRLGGVFALALVCVAGAGASASAVTRGGQQHTKPARTVRIVIDGKEVQNGSDLSAQDSAPRAGRETDLKWSNDEGSGAVRAKNIELTDDLADVKSVPADGYIFIEETRGGMTRRFRAEPGKDGKLKRTYAVNNQTHEFDADAKRWLSDILHRCFQDSSRQKP